MVPGSAPLDTHERRAEPSPSGRCRPILGGLGLLRPPERGRVGQRSQAAPASGPGRRACARGPRPESYLVIRHAEPRRAVVIPGPSRRACEFMASLATSVHP